MIRICARNNHRYTHLILALGIIREPTVWGFMISKYSCTHDIGWASVSLAEILVLAGTTGAGGMATPTSTRISARLKRVQEQKSPVNQLVEYLP